MNNIKQLGEHTGLCQEVRDCINGIKNNHPNVNELEVRSSDAEKSTDQAWRLLGRYIANNNHLTNIDLGSCGITDQKMVSLFDELKCSVSLTKLTIISTTFSIDGVRSMLPFLRNSPKLSDLQLFDNNEINTECFELLVQTLHGRPLESKSLDSLFIGNCNINNISAIYTYNLPHLQRLNLDGNNIGRDGCSTLAKILQREETSLKCLDLCGTCIDDEGAELLATSLKNNTKLQVLDLNHNYNITERGYKAFLTLLVDVSSIENTYNSNHTLTFLKLDRSRRGVSDSIRENIQSAIQINYGLRTAVKAARTKVIKYQLNSQNRKEYVIYRILITVPLAVSLQILNLFWCHISLH